MTSLPEGYHVPGNDFYQVVLSGFAPKLIGIDPVVLSEGHFDAYYAISLCFLAASLVLAAKGLVHGVLLHSTAVTVRSSLGGSEA